MPEDVRAKQSGQPDRSMGVSPMDHGQDARATQEDSGKSMPTLFLVGDSTVKNGTKGQVGWGQVIGKYFDSSKIHVENHAIGGRSSRTFITEGRWDKVLGEGKPGDYVIIQLGHNDGGPLDDPARARGTIRGIGDESKQIFNPITKQNEVVHTYGWYMRKYVEDARGHGMTPIICSPVPHWQSHVIASGEVEKSGYVQWSHEVAQQEHCLFIPLNKIVMSHWAGMPADQVHSKYFADPHTHSTPAGAELNARCVVEGIRELKHCDLKKYLLAE
jgi:lysophospholipase L1-like esterase